MHEDYRQRAQRYAAEAARRLEGHHYSRLTPLDCAAEVWRCKRPDTTNYAFDIVVSRFGIASFGDTANLMFRVGSAYGLPFLAGDDVEYYIHSKLDECCKVEELDEEHYEQVMLETIVNWLADNDYEAPAQEGMPDDTYREVLGDWIWVEYRASDVMSDDHDKLYALLDTIANSYATTANEAHETLATLASELGENYDYDYNFSRPAQHLIQDLYVLRHAARRILALKHPEPGSAMEPFASDGEPVLA